MLDTKSTQKEPILRPQTFNKFLEKRNLKTLAILDYHNAMGISFLKADRKSKLVTMDLLRFELVKRSKSHY